MVGIVMPTCNARTQKADVGRSQVLGQHSLKGTTVQVLMATEPPWVTSFQVSCCLSITLGEEECAQESDGISMGWQATGASQAQQSATASPALRSRRPGRAGSRPR